MKDLKCKELGTEKEYDSHSGFGYRHQQCIILFICFTTCYSIRSCMGVALVAMTKTRDVTIIDRILNSNGTSLNGNVNGFNAIDTNYQDKHDSVLHMLMLAKPYPTFDWNKKIQDTILSSFFWGYMILQIPAGMLSHRYGAKNLIFGSMMINGFIFIILPWGSYYGGWPLLVVCRLIQGLSQACIIPGLNTFFGKWAPSQERGKMAGTVNGGNALGAVLGLLITGFIASSDLGWPGIFRFYGLLCGLCSILLWFYVADTPAQHPKISVAERIYIENELGDSKVHPPVPWRQLLTSRGVWAMVVSHIANTWGQLTLFSEVPAYMDKIMGVNVKANGFLTAMPFLSMWLCNFLFCYMADFMVNKKICSVTTTRKIFNSIGCVTAGLGLIALSYAPKNIYVVEGILVVICSFKIAAHMGFTLVNIDIAPNFAGTIMSLSNFIANAIGSCAPVAAGFILTDVTSEAQWRIVFFVAAALYLVCNLVFVVLGTAEKADWNDVTPVKQSEDNLEESKPMFQGSKSL